jgi:dihydroceramidase
MSFLDPGFWGSPTSSVDWCELNYEHTPYLCEFFNTLSSLALVVAGAVGAFLHRRVLEARFLLAFAAVSIVGLGSIAFHATLRFELQMLDELPMLYAVILLVYILLEDGPRPRFGPWFPRGLFGYAALVTYLCTFTRGTLQFYLFQFSFGSLEFFSLYRCYRLSRKAKRTTARRLFRAGMSLYAVAIVLWFIDIRFCGAMRALPSYGIPNPQLHAWWHVLVSGGFFLLVLLIAYERAQTLGRDPEIRRALGVVPYLGYRRASSAPEGEQYGGPVGSASARAERVA